MVIKQAKEVLKIEAQGIPGLVDRVGPEFEKAIEAIMKAKGRVILAGMRKSGSLPPARGPAPASGRPCAPG